MPIVRVNLGPRSYDIVTADGESSFGEFVRLSVPEAKLALLVADDNTRPHAEHLRRHLDEVNLRTAVAVVPNGEPSKSLAQLSRLYDALAELPADRRRWSWRSVVGWSAISRALRPRHIIVGYPC